MQQFLSLFHFLSDPAFVWLGVFICLTQSAMFSGLNLALFSLNRMELEVAAGENNQAAQQVLAMRQDANFLLSTVLWGNVSINVLLALLSNSVLAGFSAFLFSTVFITLFGEIMPQAYFSRNALKMASLLSPILRFYQFILYPVAKPSAAILDIWLGKEGIVYLRERDLHRVIKKHVESDDAELDILEGIGALNFLKIDDQTVVKEGEEIDPLSIISLPLQLDLPVIPTIKKSSNDSFLQQVQASKKKWVILTDLEGYPRLVLDADGYLRAALFDEPNFNPYQYCHRPIIIKDPLTPLGDVISELKAGDDINSDEVIDQDIIIFWGEKRQIITGADILGRLLKGVHGLN